MLGSKGKGVFSSVVLCLDEESGGEEGKHEVAIKVLRGNDLMLRAGMKEAALLRDLQVQVGGWVGVEHGIFYLAGPDGLS